MKRNCPLSINFVFHHDDVLMKLICIAQKLGWEFEVGVMVHLAIPFRGPAVFDWRREMNLKTC